MKDKKYMFLSIAMIFFPLIIICIVIFDFNSSSDIEIKEDMIILNAPLCSTERLMYKNIIDIQYVDKFHYGKRNKGVRKEYIVAGWYQNNEFDSYYLISHPECHQHIIVKSHDMTFVFNFDTEKKTKTVYESLKKYQQIYKSNTAHFENVLLFIYLYKYNYNFFQK